MGRETVEDDRVCRKPDVGKADGRTRLLVDLPQTNLQLVLTTRQPLIEP